VPAIRSSPTGGAQTRRANPNLSQARGARWLSTVGDLVDNTFRPKAADGGGGGHGGRLGQDEAHDAAQQTAQGSDDEHHQRVDVERAAHDLGLHKVLQQEAGGENGALEVRGPRIWGGRPIEDAEAEQILNAVVDNGITFIDTANDYGRSEEYIGRFLSHRRNEFVLATKCGCTVCARRETDETPPVWTRENLFRGLDESLVRMRIDYVDVMQLHNPSVEHPPPILDSPETTGLNGTGSRQRLGC
jgi:hypothetical protein